MRCPKCGKENSEQAQSCVHCHEPLTDHLQARRDEDQSARQMPNGSAQSKISDPLASADQPSMKRNQEYSGIHSKPVVSTGVQIGVIIGTIFFPVVGVAMGYTYLRKDHPEEKKAGRNWLILGVVMFIVNIVLISMLK